ncbi:proline--tRNA ligase [Desulfotalea psychrophila]|uniref:Proline--tRNA ligase n=1 Tax=Desulfotalea psychrophila (strain LSv54 / DSM 12343) TaxID=177439 RepID=SYP_DESPS|nr:proline--tRNA ligase [Desulfotalea psychrophila]Q6AP31.1 RecName: Full=Proline--tRNA ligase; AltName: Full=Prolyl-tRNA synthetase; Short=ProRS [Desulfotalea psychrophila LSv54]CAG35893.1 probable prolyl-tRNA synthetase [Desulfotalea psychrophila LSv54]
MRYSQSFIPTKKETPAEAEVASHQLMLRAGFMRKLSSGVYSYLPYGLAAIRKVENIVREEMNRAGAQEMLMPMVQPADLWKETGRYEKYGPELLRFFDRNNRESCLGPTHEEVITDIVRNELSSYRDLPINLYQIQTKFRDEIRPRFGLMRGREFVMKDAYSFDVDDEQANLSYDKMFEAYKRIFTRCGLQFRPVQADSGAIGGSHSHEFMVLAKTGEDTIVVCKDCEYAANMEKAEVKLVATENDEALAELEKIETPGKRKVNAVCDFLQITPQQLVKTMVFEADGEAVAVLVRGDREVEEVKLKNLLGVADVELMDDKAVFDATGVPTGYLGPVAIPIRVVADQEVMVMKNFYVGGNEKNFHLKNVNIERDCTVSAVADLRQISTDDPCPRCGGRLELTEGIEVGHVFKLGTGYSESMNARFQDGTGDEKPFVMGCYGIGVSRVVAAAIEQNHDKDGIIFPVPLAPYTVTVLNLGLKDPEITAAAEKLYAELQAAGLSVLLDDRDERPGAKFKDADLLGIPYRLTVGKGLAKNGMVEVRRRRDGHTEEMTPEVAADFLARCIQAELTD